MALITLTTDWQGRDYYSGMMRGRLNRLIENAQVCEINHSIEPFHVLQAAFVLRQVLPEFPAGTVHLLMVNQGHLPDLLPAVAKYRDQYLVGWDDGILAFIIEEEPDSFLKISAEILDRMDRISGVDESAKMIVPSFPELSVFSRIAFYLAAGHSLDEAGATTGEMSSPNSLLPVIGKDQIDGQVIFIDGYGNAITNIGIRQFERTGNSRKFEITVKSNYYRLHSLSVTYMDSEPGELLALFNSASLIEIAVAQGNAAELLGLEPGTPVKIKFDYDQQRGNSAILQPPA